MEISAAWPSSFFNKKNYVHDHHRYLEIKPKNVLRWTGFSTLEKDPGFGFFKQLNERQQLFYPEFYLACNSIDINQKR